nr:putative polyprenyl diphosphate synthase [Streptomyces atrovirens]
MGLMHMRVPVTSAPVRQESSLPGLLGLAQPEFESRMSEALEVVEGRLRGHVSGAPRPGVADVSDLLGGSAGGRLRPFLVLLGAEFGESWENGVTEAAVMVELLHVSSVTGAESGADWLLARSAQLAAGLGPRALELNARTAGRLVGAQLRQLAGPAPGEDPVAHYFEVTAGATAALLSLSLGVGALQAGTRADWVRALIGYGEHLGAALRIADDLLAVTAPAGGDGARGDPFTGAPGLPRLLARTDTTARGAELRRLVTDGATTEAARRRALELLRASPATRRAEAALHERLAAAVSAVGILPPLPARRALYALCDVVALRTGLIR